MGVPKVTYYETKLSAMANIRLLLVRRLDEVKCYCLGKDRSGKRKPHFDGYYNFNELKKIA